MWKFAVYPLIRLGEYVGIWIFATCCCRKCDCCNCFNTKSEEIFLSRDKEEEVLLNSRSSDLHHDKHIGQMRRVKFKSWRSPFIAHVLGKDKNGYIVSFLDESAIADACHLLWSGFDKESRLQ